MFKITHGLLEFPMASTFVYPTRDVSSSITYPEDNAFVLFICYTADKHKRDVTVQARKMGEMQKCNLHIRKNGEVRMTEGSNLMIKVNDE